MRGEISFNKGVLCNQAKRPVVSLNGLKCSVCSVEQNLEGSFPLLISIL